MMKEFWNDENGQGMVEYALIIALIAIVLVAALGGVKDKLAAKFKDIGTELGKAGAAE